MTFPRSHSWAAVQRADPRSLNSENGPVRETTGMENEGKSQLWGQTTPGLNPDNCWPRDGSKSLQMRPTLSLTGLGGESRVPRNVQGLDCGCDVGQASTSQDGSL